MSSDADRGRSPPSGVVPDLGRAGHVLRGAGEREHGIPFTSCGRGGRFRGGIGAVRRIGAGVGSVHRTRHGPSRVLRTGRAAEMRCGIAPDPGAGRNFRPCRRVSRCHRERRAPRAFGEGVHACRIKERGQKGHPWWWVRGGRRPSARHRRARTDTAEGHGRGAPPSSGQLGSASPVGRSRRERIGDHKRINAASGMPAVSSHIVGRTPNSVPRPPARSAPSGRVP